MLLFYSVQQQGFMCLLNNYDIFYSMNKLANFILNSVNLLFYYKYIERFK
jgi:hypothetical protein